ncbi:hypothetical protein AGMMS50225_15330 [Betaproteobacteria bacterium]|nr:hypothetical protein AGMMS50225_15330 [Betaproteobacteria bacterium]
MFYPIEIEHERPGFWAWCPDIPEMKTAGDTQEDLMREAVDALETAFDFYFDDRRPVPPPPPRTVQRTGAGGGKGLAAQRNAGAGGEEGGVGAAAQYGPAECRTNFQLAAPHEN